MCASERASKNTLEYTPLQGGPASVNHFFVIFCEFSPLSFIFKRDYSLKMVQPLALHEMNYFELCDKLRLPDEEFEEWMKALGLIHSSMTCDRCQEPM